MEISDIGKATLGGGLEITFHRWLLDPINFIWIITILPNWPFNNMIKCSASRFSNYSKTSYRSFLLGSPARQTFVIAFFSIILLFFLLLIVGVSSGFYTWRFCELFRLPLEGLSMGTPLFGLPLVGREPNSLKGFLGFYRGGTILSSLGGRYLFIWKWLYLSYGSS